MTSIKIIKAVGGLDNGAIVERGAGAAAYLVNAGYAEEVEAKTDQPKRTRRAAKADDVTTDDE